MQAVNGKGLVREAREARGLSQDGLAALLGINRSSVSDTERRGDGATIAVLRRYGEAMGLELVIYYADPDAEPPY